MIGASTPSAHAPSATIIPTSALIQPTVRMYAATRSCTSRRTRAALMLVPKLVRPNSNFWRRRMRDSIMKKAIRRVRITSITTVGVAKAISSRKLGVASTTSRGCPSRAIRSASWSLTCATQEKRSCNSPKRSPTRFTSAGNSSKSVIAGWRISASARSRIAKKTSKDISEASALGSPQPFSLSASGERMTVRMTAVTTGRKTIAPIDRTKGKARNKPTPRSRTRAEIRRNSCCAKALRWPGRRTGGGDCEAGS